MSHFGHFVVTGGADRSIRVWERTDDPLFLEEEREKEMDETYETNLLNTLNKEDRAIGSGAGQGEDGQDVQDEDAGGHDDAGETDAVKKQTAESLMAGEKILQALEIYAADAQVYADYQESLRMAPESVRQGLLPPQRNAMILAASRQAGDPETGIKGEEYVRRVVEGVKGPGLEDALLVLPFDRIKTLVSCLDTWISTSSSISLSTRILFFLLRTHHHQIVSNRHLRSTLLSLRTNLRTELRREKDLLGYNLAGLKYVKRLDDSEKMAGILEAEMMDESEVKRRIEEGVKKRKRVAVM